MTSPNPHMVAAIALAVLRRVIFKVMLSTDMWLVTKADAVVVWARPDRDVEMVLRKERGVTLERSMLQHVLISPIFL